MVGVSDVEAVFDIAIKVADWIERLIAGGVAYNAAIAQVKATIEKARAEGRNLNAAEWDALIAEGDAELTTLGAKAGP